MLPDLAPLLNPGINDEFVRVRQGGIIAGVDNVVLKFKSHSSSEVAGYELATWIEMPRLRYAGFWSSERISVGRNESYPGRVGVALEQSDHFARLSRLEAARLDPLGTAAFLTLCLFNRHEWGEPALDGERLIFFDLEFTFPGIAPEQIRDPDISETYLEDSLFSYVGENAYALSETFDEATSLGIVGPFKATLADLYKAVFEENRRLDFAGHPDACVIEEHMMAGFRSRLDYAAKRLNAV